MKKTLAAVALVVAGLPALADIEMVETKSSLGPLKQWWPRVAPPKGWAHDREHSVAYGLNAMVPEGTTFGDAETVIYAKALYRPREMELRDVDNLIERDRRKASTQDPPRKTASAPALKTGDGRALKTVTYTPVKGEANWERVAYGQEGEYFVLFAVSSRTKKGFDAARPAFEAMVRGYREKP